MKPLVSKKHPLTEPIWHLQVTMILAMTLQLFLPDRYVFVSRFLLIGVEALLLVALSFTTPKERIFKSYSRRVNVFLLIGFSSAANIYSLVEIANRLLSKNQVSNGRDLILTALNIFMTNIIIFGLWYWEMDGGGPGQRLLAKKHDQDFLFPQNRHENFRHPDWQPMFVDYLYLAAVNAMAFSSADTMPLSRRAKVLMLAQSSISLITIALVAARAVSILG